MKLTFLGTSSATPSRKRNVSGLALTFVQRGAWWLFDCGEGTQHQIQKTALRLGRLEAIFITHLHGDHIFGLPGLLASRSLQDSAESGITIYGPRGIKEFVDTAMRVSGSHVGYPLTIVEISDKSAPIELNDIHVEWLPLSHGIRCYGYAVTEADKPGRLDVEALSALGVQPGREYGLIKSGQSVTLPDGRVIDGKDYVGAPIVGRKVVICGDTMPCENAVTLAAGADVLVYEATFIESDIALAKRANHSTSAQAAGIAAKAGVRQLILTHLSPRYDDKESPTLAGLLWEATSLFPNTVLAEDLWTVDVPRGG